MKINSLRQHKPRLGFTVVELMLVLAAAGAMTILAISSIRGVIESQRYTDSVNSLRDFLREQYNGLLNNSLALRDVSKVNYCATNNQQQRGRTDCLLLGKLMKFETLTSGSEKYTVIKAWDVIGNEKVTNVNNDDEYFRSNQLDLRVVDGSIVGVPSSYTDYELDWRAFLTYKDANNLDLASVDLDSPSTNYYVLMIRSALTNSVRTYAKPNVLATSLKPVVEELLGIGSVGDGWQDNLKYQPTLCVNHNGSLMFGSKRAIVMRPNGYNASAVEVAPSDVDVVDRDGYVVKAVKCN